MHLKALSNSSLNIKYNWGVLWEIRNAQAETTRRTWQYITIRKKAQMRRKTMKIWLMKNKHL